MNSIDKLALSEQKAALRQQLRVQRARIEQRIEPAEPPDDEFPRSKTMRFLMQRPQLLSTLGLVVSTRLIGPRTFKGIAMAWSLLGLLRTSKGSRRHD